MHIGRDYQDWWSRNSPVVSWKELFISDKNMQPQDTKVHPTRYVDCGFIQTDLWIHPTRSLGSLGRVYMGLSDPSSESTQKVSNQC